MEISLRPYQQEVVQVALRGENSIIWLPTGGGKTRAAVYVAKRHLETHPNGKVAVLVNKVHLVDQHFQKEFRPHLGSSVKMVPISGDSNEKDFFGCVVRDSSLVICTAQILENALINTEESKHVELTDFTLLIIDECHHTHKEGVYNKIMARYVRKKIERVKGLPQILGLTASPGTGGAKSLDGAITHVLEICANLDSVIVSTKNYEAELKEAVPRPMKNYDIVDERYWDPFGDHLKMMMKLIHEFMMLDRKFTLREMGTQEYEADVVELEKKGVQEQNRLLARCALHLRKFNDALLINDTVRMVDALRLLEEFYTTETRNVLDITDEFLTGLFNENKVELLQLASEASNENPKLERLQRTLVDQFKDENSRGIIFAKTREITRCLYDWVRTNPELRRANIRAANLVGAGTGATHMTQREQRDTIKTFREGELNLLISTSVAEEGLDIPECNVVIRYGLLTNEIAQQQASGRARAKNSVYSVVAKAGGREMRKEKTNEYLEELTSKAIAHVQSMEPGRFRQKIFELQHEAVTARILMANQRERRRLRYDAAEVEFDCRGCFTAVARGDDMRLVNDTQHININPDFERFYKVGGQVYLERTFEDWEPGRTISCVACGQNWGMEVKLKNLVLPCLNIKGFSMKTRQSSRTAKQWKDIEFLVEEFDFVQYVKNRYPDLEQD
ncbi:probable ATP-dependent RNA helicase DHX58 [Ictalurus punctatus]|uniref:RNA helicase n=1 Tax=Ictalurus punctatus TaxID=7998 RepID=J9XXU4_ICTPU|nr:probable ATP-dependent RNA helicase DHX58 [Ictalurus punctatus]AFS34610.1 LGP2 [Ictalurus punctatus]